MLCRPTKQTGMVFNNADKRVFNNVDKSFLHRRKIILQSYKIISVLQIYFLRREEV